MHNWVILFKTGEIYSAIILISIFFIVLSSGFVLFIIRFKVRQGTHYKEKKEMEQEFAKQLMKSQIEVQEATMSYLGQELHDNICQQITSAKLLVAYALRRPENAGETLLEMELQLGHTISDVRQLTKSLEKEWVTQFDLIYNLQTEINRINNAKIIDITLNAPDLLPLSSDKQLILFRIMQEILQNTLRHSGAKNFAITIIPVNQTLELTFADDGGGFKLSGTPGLGMKNMKHRTSILAGTISWNPTEKGTTVHISIPIYG